MYSQTNVSQFGTVDTKLKQMQVQIMEMEETQAEMVRQNMQLRQELKQASDQISKKKADKLEELLTDLVNEMMDSYR
jgi:regulator of replication initiation timing